MSAHRFRVQVRRPWRDGDPERPAWRQREGELVGQATYRRHRDQAEEHARRRVIATRRTEPDAWAVIAEHVGFAWLVDSDRIEP